jgi:D-alanyl-D-alanine carboxypeptidase (penicillin-binding protein 5/6)
MKKLKLLFFIMMNLESLFALEVPIESRVALLINLENQRVLYEKNADKIISPASTTKIATALYALKEVGEDLDMEITADQDCVGSITAEMQKTMNYNYPPYWQIIGGTHMELRKGDHLTLEELFYGMMLVSANDASNVIAKYVSGGILHFVSELNEYLEELGCKNTRFKNPHGLHYPGHTTTARELALITTEALKYPFFRKLVKTQKRGNLKNTNLLVQEGSSYYYPYAIGIKTGYHSEGENCLVAAAEYEGRTLLLVLAECADQLERFVDARKLFQAAFAEKEVSEIYLNQGLQKFKHKLEEIKKPIQTYLNEAVVLSYFPSEKPKVKGTIHWHPPALPIQKGDCVADLVLKDVSGRVLNEVPLLAYQKVKVPSLKMKWLLSLLVIGSLIIGMKALLGKQN